MFYLGARLSNSSKKRIVGLPPLSLAEADFAFSNTLLTEASLSPMYLDNNSGPCNIECDYDAEGRKLMPPHASPTDATTSLMFMLAAV